MYLEMVFFPLKLWSNYILSKKNVNTLEVDRYFESIKILYRGFREKLPEFRPLVILGAFLFTDYFIFLYLVYVVKRKLWITLMGF